LVDKADQNCALTGLPVPVYFYSYSAVSTNDKGSSEGGWLPAEFLRQVIRATFGSGCLWGLSAAGRSFSAQAAETLLLPEEIRYLIVCSKE
jgi:hypothetical protein